MPMARDIMDITMQKGMIKFSGNRLTMLSLALAGALGLSPSITVAKELQLQASVKSELSHREVKSDIRDNSISSLNVTPDLIATFQSNKLTFTGNLSSTYIYRDADGFSSEDNYTNYNYSAIADVIPNLFNISVTGNRQYRSAGLETLLITNYDNNEQDLIKSERNSLLADYSSTSGDWINVNSEISYTKAKADGNSQTFRGIDSDVFVGNLTLLNGERSRHIQWSVNNFYTKSKGQTGSAQNLTNYRILAKADISLFGGLAIRLNGTDETNEYNTDNSDETVEREFTSYGAGLTYFFSENTFLSVTHNKISSPDTNNELEESTEEDTFIGVELSWMISPRTQLKYQRSRRFYGDSTQASFSFSNRRIRITSAYQESVTNTAELISSPQQGLFVCPVGSVNISECSLSDSLDYVPAEDELLFNVTIPDYSLQDVVILRKSANVAAAMTFSKLTLGASASSVDSESLSSIQGSYEALSGAITMTYQFGAYTDFQATYQYVDNTQSTNNESEENASISRSASVRLNRTVGQSLSFFVDFTSTTRSGNITDNVLGNNYEDNRLSLGMSYTFK